MRLPITVMLMRRIKQALSVNSHSYENVLLWAACCTGFFGFLRCAEFLTPDDTPFDPQVHLSLDDLAYRHTATPHTSKSRSRRQKRTSSARGQR